MCALSTATVEFRDTLLGLSNLCGASIPQLWLVCDNLIISHLNFDFVSGLEAPRISVFLCS